MQNGNGVRVDHLAPSDEPAPAPVDLVRQMIADAEREGRPRPGRPTLRRETGATDHQIRQVLAEVDTSTASATAADGEEGSRATPGLSGDRPAAWTGGHAGVDLAPATASPVNAGEPVATIPGGRLVAWLGFAFGSIMSIAANVLHTWLPASTMPAGWAPGIAPQVGAAVWPIGLLISVEVLSRVAWKPGFLWGLARYGGAGTVAIGSGVISYGHLRGVLEAWGYGHPGADVGPLVLDGLMVVSGFALLAMGGARGGDAGASARQRGDSAVR